MNTRLMMWCDVCYTSLSWNDEIEYILAAEALICPCCKQENKVTDEMVETIADWMGIEVTVIEELRSRGDE